MQRGSLGRVGFLWPADGLNDDEFWRFLPDGVAWLTARYDAGDGTGELTLENLAAFADPAVLWNAAGLLRAARPHVVACGDHAASFVLGSEGEGAMTEAITNRLGCPAVTMGGAVIEALAHLDCGRVAIASPYSRAVTDRLVAHLAENGMDCVALRVFGETDEMGIGTRAAAEWTRHLDPEFGTEVRASGAQALHFAGGGVRLADAIAGLEARLGCPVVTGPGALVWAAARRLGIAVEGNGLGRLFAGADRADFGTIRRHLSPATKTYAVSDTPPVFVSGAGAHLFDGSGRSWLDFACGSGTTSLGHAHPAIQRALSEQIATGLLHVGPHFHSASQVRLFDALGQILPPHLNMYHPSISGAEATECAIKAVMHATGARHFAVFEGGYHGRTLGAMAVSSSRGPNAGLGPLCPAATVLPFPETPDDADEVLSRLEQIKAPLAGVIVEPIQATAGLRIADAEALRRIAAIAKTRGAPLIVDEVFTGLGRTARMFGFEHMGLEPDIVILGKSFGGGLPAAAIAGRRDILKCWPEGSQSATFQLHPAAAATATAMIETVRRQDVQDRIAEIASWFARALPSLQATPGVRAVKAIGAFGAVEMDTPRCARLARRLALERGLVTWGCGLSADVIGLVPPFIVTEEEFCRARGILQNALRDAASTD